MMKRTFSILVVAFAFALLPLRTFAANIFNGTTSFSNTIADPCTGENVDISGTDHLVVNETFDGNGGAHISTHENIHVTGTGNTTGASYVGSQSLNSEENDNSGGTITMTLALPFELISKGSAPNFLVHALLHITINPNGVVTSSIDTFSEECTG